MRGLLSDMVPILDRLDAILGQPVVKRNMPDPPTHDPDACDVPACPLCQELARDRAMEMKGDLRRGT